MTPAESARESQEPWFSAPQRILQKAYNLDVGEPSDLTQAELLKLVDRVGHLLVHRVFYDGEFRSMPEINELLREKPNGVFASVLRKVRDRRVENGDYTAETLNKMYGIT